MELFEFGQKGDTVKYVVDLAMNHVYFHDSFRDRREGDVFEPGCGAQLPGLIAARLIREYRTTNPDVV